MEKCNGGTLNHFFDSIRRNLVFSLDLMKKIPPLFSREGARGRVHH
jgi:hypothetical protein